MNASIPTNFTICGGPRETCIHVWRENTPKNLTIFKETQKRRKQMLGRSFCYKKIHKLYGVR